MSDESAIPEAVRRAAENVEREWQLPPLSILDFLDELNDNGFGIAKIDESARFVDPQEAKPK